MICAWFVCEGTGHFSVAGSFSFCAERVLVFLFLDCYNEPSITA